MGLIDKITKQSTAKKDETDAKKAPQVSDTPESTQKKSGGSAASKARAYDVLIHPCVTEKTTMQESMGQYTFVVDLMANKVEIKKAIQTLYGVTPSRVHALHYDGKSRRSGRFTGRGASYKKAVVFMPKGVTIDIHEGV